MTQPDFAIYLARHGEFGVQALVEGLERYENIRHGAVISLEDRWNALMLKNAANDRGENTARNQKYGSRN